MFEIYKNNKLNVLAFFFTEKLVVSTTKYLVAKGIHEAESVEGSNEAVFSSCNVICRPVTRY